MHQTDAAALSAARQNMTSTLQRARKLNMFLFDFKPEAT